MVEKRWRPRICRLGSLFSSTLEERRWRLLKCSSSGGNGGGRWPAFSSTPATFLAERQPTIFLPASTTLGRQFLFLLGGYGLQLLRPWRSRRTKWCVPGGDEVLSMRRQLWTRLRFLHPVRGPSCKKPGACLLFPVSVEFLCKMYYLFEIIII